MKKSRSLPADDTPDLDISSMIDVCFLLLIYFLVTSTIMPREQDLGVTLPGVPDRVDSLDDVIPVGIVVKESGEILWQSDDNFETLDSDPAVRELPQLAERLRVIKLVAAPDEPLVTINVDDEASQQRFIDVVNCLAGEGVTRVTVADFDAVAVH